MVTFELNGKPYSFDGDAMTPLLWAIREGAGLTGSKFGCGVGACGACTVHLNGEAVRSCIIAVGNVADMKVTTIEGLSDDLGHPLQKAWIAEDVPQCGYCQSGMIMSAAALLSQIPAPSDEQIDEYMTNLCRCATYQRIRKAIHTAAKN